MINKVDLKIDPQYQRELVPAKVRDITAQWSWIACGAIIVAERNGDFWAIDGQHRVAAALRRSDIQLLPCIVFQSQGVADEAESFLRVNTNRKPIDSIAKHRAKLAANDEDAAFIESTLKACGLKVASSSDQPLSVHCLGWCAKRVKDDRDAFASVLSLVAQMAIDTDYPKPLPSRVLDGLWHINTRCAAGLNDKRLVERIKSIGVDRLLHAANRAAQLYAAGGAKIWAQGMLEEINKGLRYKYTLGRD